MSEPLLQFGYVSRAHGLDGEVVVRTFDPTSSVLDEVERVLVRPRQGPDRELKLAGVREAPKGDLLVRFEEITKRVPAEALVGGTLFVFREDLSEPEEGEYFQGDLLGLTAVDEHGAVLGVVAEIWNSGPVPNLVIRAEGKEELMVPFVDEYVPSVDLKSKRVTVRPLVIE